MSLDGQVAFRRKIGDAVWHWCRTCPQWPSYRNSIEIVTPPPTEERCRECLLIDKTLSECQPNPA